MPAIATINANNCSLPRKKLLPSEAAKMISSTLVFHAGRSQIHNSQFIFQPLSSPTCAKSVNIY